MGYNRTMNINGYPGIPENHVYTPDQLEEIDYLRQMMRPYTGPLWNQFTPPQLYGLNNIISNVESNDRYVAPLHFDPNVVNVGMKVISYGKKEQLALSNTSNRRRNSNLSAVDKMRIREATKNEIPVNVDPSTGVVTPTTLITAYTYL